MTSVTPPRDRPRWWIAAITFVTGVVVGIVMVGLLSLSLDPWTGRGGGGDAGAGVG
jgi:hypothetical protein